MRFIKIAIVIFVLLAAGIFLFLIFNQSALNPKNIPSSEKIREEVTDSMMKLTSLAFEDGADIPSKYTCDGENISLPLLISEVPGEAKTLALIVDDPDAPSGDWTHWLVWNINPMEREIGEGKTFTDAVTGLNDFGKNNYGGPCPPSGRHKYQFKIYALDTSLDLKPMAKKKDLLAAMQGHILSQVLIVGYYQRK